MPWVLHITFVKLFRKEVALTTVAIVTEAFLAELNSWVNQGRRSVKIEIDNLSQPAETKVWCYDYDLANGRFVVHVGDIPTKEDLLEKTRAELNEKLQQLNKE